MSPVPAPICRMRLNTAPADMSNGEMTAVSAISATTVTRPTRISSRSPACGLTKRFQKSFAT